MSVIQFSIVKIEDAVDEIRSIVADAYGKENSVNDLEITLSDVFDEMKEGLSAFIEYPYVDRVYRDSYYTYFASKHKDYYRDCIRVSLFNDAIKPNFFRDEKKHKYLQKNYLGYLIIRPTFPKVIGRSLLSKNVYEDANYVICNYKGNVMLNGVKLSVEGFPHSSQDTESISCAETTIWGLMEYFGNRYADYRPTLPSSILEVLTKFSKQRLLPSNGLTVDQISYALKEFGFGTYIYSKEDAYGNELTNIIAIYIESGIPIIAALKNETIGHAILIIGHNTDPEVDFKKQKTRTIEYGTKKVKYIDYTDIYKKFVVQDDNLMPYRLVDLNYPVEHYEKIDTSFLTCQIESIVVPLYKKIYLEADKAKKLALNIVSDSEFGYKFNSKFVFRFYLASSRSFKHHIAILPDLDKQIQNDIILSKMPKFVWCGEFYEKDDFAKNKATGLIILDATEASDNKKDALLFAGYPKKCWLRIGKEFVSLEKDFNLYTRFKNNLE